MDTARALAVEAAGHGRAGTATSPAPAAHLLFQRLLRNDPGDPGWSHRDPEEGRAPAVHGALSAAREETGRPSLVALRTLTGRPSPSGRDSGRDGARDGGQDLPVPDRCGAGGTEPAEGTARGGYVLAEAEGGAPQVVLIATGSEVPVALDARAILQREGIAARVVSMPCPQGFREQSAAYREEVLPSGVRARVSVEAGSALGGYQLFGDAGIPVALGQFGAGAPYAPLHRQHGFTAERVAATARAGLARAAHREAR
ncbi:transketolase C-terminal domain-containing protein [Streptomyces sp. NPDC006326]|uniref:transketolase-like TK C-terminal-containing protein n=1 Tax=Streptomyces sp. NPDC006326 TaxID=3156752 RepID=UPI0033A78778